MIGLHTFRGHAPRARWDLRLLAYAAASALLPYAAAGVLVLLGQQP